MEEELTLTIEEAINTIKGNYPTSGYRMLCKALDMAIVLFEKELKED